MKFATLIILDGWGIAPPGNGNPISLATLAYYKYLLNTFPHGELKASGEAVGLPRGEDGNTETGHLNLGAGRIVYQNLPRINMSIADGTFFKNEAFLSAINHAKKNNSNLHIIGLVGSGGVHSNIEHLFALLELAKEQQFDRIFLHLFTDGRDSPPQSALIYLEQVEEHLRNFKLGKIASIMGRYFAMDRDKHWDRIEKAFFALTQGQGVTASNYKEAIQNAYAKNQTDEFIEPTIIYEDGHPLTTIRQNDSVIFFNFRIDRPRELTKTFTAEDFEKEANKTTFDPFAVKYFKKHEAELGSQVNPFARGPKIQNLFFVSMTEYASDIKVSAIAFPPARVGYPLGRVISERGLRQLRLSESEKERFVTYYFNGHQEIVYPGEERIIIPSPKVPTYDLKPEMSAFELTHEIINQVSLEKFTLIVINFANPDMVAHTGSLGATIRAVEVIDKCLSQIVPTILEHGGYLLITGDHGNAEELIDPQTGGVDTEHSINPVPFIAIGKPFLHHTDTLPMGILADIAPTILALLGIPKPSDMSGRNLLQNLEKLYNS
ncbi:2,3-bisphosphoglycerate-independent phosphoglycerate mutase [Candidatus Gottesmanbacteria bacterium]|nr:2,3-bisphosphoglycerate-independent phosphoglycerate mutase [Candidatus Gottesmanbacteria bacterium]